MNLKAALLTALTVIVLLVYVIASFSVAYPESGAVGWVWVASAIAVLANSYVVILRVRGKL